MIGYCDVDDSSCNVVQGIVDDLQGCDEYSELLSEAEVFFPPSNKMEDKVDIEGLSPQDWWNYLIPNIDKPLAGCGYGSVGDVLVAHTGLAAELFKQASSSENPSYYLAEYFMAQARENVNKGNFATYDLYASLALMFDYSLSTLVDLSLMELSAERSAESVPTAEEDPCPLLNVVTPLLIEARRHILLPAFESE